MRRNTAAAAGGTGSTHTNNSTPTKQESPPQLRRPPSLSRAPSSTLSDAAATTGLSMPSLRQSVSYTLGMPINRQNSALQHQRSQAPGLGLLQQQQQDEWRTSLTGKERADMKKHIYEAFKKHAHSFDDVLELAIALQEESLYALSASRLDYIKDSVQFEKRLVEAMKKKNRDEVVVPAAAEKEEKKEEETAVVSKKKEVGEVAAAGSKGRSTRRGGGGGGKVEEAKEEEAAVAVESASSSHKRKKPRK